MIIALLRGSLRSLNGEIPSNYNLHNMKKLLIVLPLFFSACDDNVVSRTEYDVMLSEKKELEGLNDSLQFELSSLRTYVECLEEDNAELVEELRRTPSDQQ